MHLPEGPGNLSHLPCSAGNRVVEFLFSYFRRGQFAAIVRTMTNKNIPSETQTAVLLRSRRRCCICYGLNRDTDMKAGRIAHLDQDSSNASEDNLAFLCFEHHDEYDSRTVQSKGMTAEEVKHFRSELHEAIGHGFTLPVHFGSVTLPPKDPYAGQWIRTEPTSDSAELILTPVPDDGEGNPRYAVTGTALWGVQRETGLNLGSVAFIGTVRGDVLGEVMTQAEHVGEFTHNLTITFHEHYLTAFEFNPTGVHSERATFLGTYERG